MWRDRTNLYISYRQSYTHHPANKAKASGSRTNGIKDNGFMSEERRGLMSAGAFDSEGDAIIELDQLPPRWSDVQEEVSGIIDKITRQTATLDPMLTKHVLPGFEDESVKRKEEREIERLTQDITRGFQSCQKAIKGIESMVRDAKRQGTLHKGEDIMAKNLQISLATRVGEVSASFRKKQSAYLKKLRVLSGMGSPLDRTSTPMQNNSYMDTTILETDADRSMSQSMLQQTAQKRRFGNEASIAQREREIEDIAQGIIELANIFQELQTMVIDQGTMLDRIDYNVESMAVDVKAADKELTTATGYQRRSAKRKIILLLVLIVVGMIILLFIKPRRKSSVAESTSTPAANSLL